jgi:hypothetical protein
MAGMLTPDNLPVFGDLKALPHLITLGVVIFAIFATLGVVIFAIFAELRIDREEPRRD